MCFEGQRVSVLIDSGSTDCFIGPELIRMFPEKHKNLYDLPKPSIGRLANGDKFVCRKAVNLDIQIGSDVVPITALFSETLNYPLIIGYNTLAENKLIIDFENLSIFRKPDSQVKLVRSTSLPPMSETIIYGYLRDPMPNGTGMVTGSPNLENVGILAANAVVTVKKDNDIIPVKVLNLSDEKVDLPAHFCLASCSHLKDTQIIDVQDCDDFKLNATERCVLQKSNCGYKSQEEFAKQFKINDNATSEQQKQLIDLLWDFKDLFPAEGQKLGCTDLIEFKITLRDDARPLKARPYRSNPTIRREITKQVQQMLEDDIIRPSTSNFVSPVLLVEKADGSLRFVTDFRRMNSQNIVPEVSILPRIDCSLESLGSAKAKLFSTLDLLKGYWQIAIEESSKRYTAFITHDGVFEYNRMPFGLANSPACFMRLMTRVLQGLMWETCLVYLDDIIIFSSDFTEHLHRLRQVFERIRSANLAIKSKKSNFLCEEIQFLGHLITPHGILPLPAKVESIKTFPRPTNAKEIQSFLGLVGYYRKFIEGFSVIAGPLLNLTRHGVDFIWTDKCEKAFIALRDALQSPPVLAYPEYDQPYILETDASNYSVGFILSQRQEGRIRPIAYSGKRLNDAQKNYSTTEKEALAVVLGFQQFDSFLRGNKVHVVTDHIALKWLLSHKQPKGRIARWIAYLQQFDYDVEHKAGKCHTNADTLSRIHHETDASHVEDVIDDELFPVSCVVTSTDTDVLPNDPTPVEATNLSGVRLPQPRRKEYIYPTTKWTLEELRKHQLNDEWCKQMVDYLENNTLPGKNGIAREILLLSDRYVLNNKVLYRIRDTHKKNRKRQIDEIECCLVVPAVLKQTLLEHAHGVSTASHFGYRRTYDTIQLKYYWKGMFTDVRNWVLSCEKCNTKKSPIHPLKAPLHPLPPTRVNERWAMDLVTMPRTDRGNRYILTFTEYNTRFAEAFALPNSQATTIARVLVDEICFRYGAPQCLLSDLGANLIASVVAETCKLFNIERISTSGYHPETNALIERLQTTLVRNIAMYVNSRHTDWDVYLKAVCYAYNTTVCNESTQFTPFYLMYGRVPLNHIDAMVLPPVHPSDTVREAIVKLQEAREMARQNIIQVQETMKQRYDKKAQDPEFQPGDLVWIYIPQIVVGGTKKFYHNYSGPFVLLEKVGPVDFTVAHAHSGKKLRNRIHVNRMKRFHHRTVMPPPMENPQELAMEASELDELNPVDRERVLIPAESQVRAPLPLRMAEDHNIAQQQISEPQLASPQLDSAEVINQNIEAPVETVVKSDSPETYEINKIIHKRYNKKGEAEYLIDWKGYTKSDRTYEPRENLNQSAQDYVDSHKIPAINKPPKRK